MSPRSGISREPSRRTLRDRGARGLHFALLATLLAGTSVLAGCTPDSERTDAELYQKYCSKCHGEDGRGDESLREGDEDVNLLASDSIRDGDRAFVHRRVAYGYGQMPAYIHKLDPPDLERLVDFVMQMQQGALAGEGAEASHGTPAVDR